MRILQVTTFFNGHGGVERAVSDLSHSLSSDHDVEVLCTVKGRTRRYSSDAVSVTAAGSPISVSGRPIPFGFLKELSQKTADVVHYHLPCPIAVFAERLVRPPKAQIRVATWHHDLVRHGAFNRLMSPSLDKFLNSLDSILVTAPQLMEHTPALRRYRDKCHVIPLGIEHSRFEAPDSEEVRKIREQANAPIILYVGRLVYYKGCDVLLSAMRNVPDAKLMIVGTGPLEEQLSNKIREFNLQDRVRLLGWQSEAALQVLFKACDLFVLPSTHTTECFGLVQVEAMLCGKPVINTNLATGVPWVSLNGETGLTVTPNNSLQLSAAIRLLLSDDHLRELYGRQARQRALELFTLDAHRKETLNHYHKLLPAELSRRRERALDAL